MSNANSSSTTGKIEFIPFHQPALKDGDYTIILRQTLQAYLFNVGPDCVSDFTGELNNRQVSDSLRAQFQEHDIILSSQALAEVKEAGSKWTIVDAKRTYLILVENQTLNVYEIDDFGATRKFSVAGPRFNLNPQDIQAVFPPPGSLGEHSNVLPHIILKRSTLPWERSADGESQDLPWLALLLFDEEDVQDQEVLKQIKTPKSYRLSKLIESSGPNPFKVSLLKSSDSKDSKDYNVYFPTVTKKTGDHEDDAVAVIDVPNSLLWKILPSRDDLKWLAHVRQTTDEAGKPQGDEVAVIICNRLPKPGGLSIVHLVSVEGRYSSNEFQYQDAQDEDLIRLVSLYSWRFACISEQQSFKGLLLHLNHPLLFNITTTEKIVQYLQGQAALPTELKQAFVQSGHAVSGSLVVTDSSGWKIIDREQHYFVGTKTGNFKVYNQAGKDLNFSLTMAPQLVSSDVRGIFAKHGHPLSNKAKVVTSKDRQWWLQDDRKQYFIHREIDNHSQPASDRLYVYYQDLDSTGTLGWPPMGNDRADPYLKLGYVALPHAMRQGNHTVSWYHGPLIPGANTTQDGSLPTFPIRTADQLVRYDSSIGMFDVSYAAAWELGRLLALQSKRFSIDLFNWKRSHTKRLKDAESQLTHLPFAAPATSLDMPANVRDWFGRLERLEGVPFNYLVSDESMLPPESIRFFQVDRLWIECLLDGAFSIGRVLASDHNQDCWLKADHLAGLSQRVSGLLLRSDVVAGWPGLLVDGYDIIDNQNNLVDRYTDELNDGTVSADLLQAFCDRGLALSEGSTVSMTETAVDSKTGVAWLISDQQTHTSYEVEKRSSRLDIKLHMLRMDRLSKNVLICLFDGEAKAVDIHQKPETLHFGINRPDEGHDYYHKELRHPDGTENTVLIAGPIPWKDGSKDDKHINRVIDIGQLANGKNGIRQVLMDKGVAKIGDDFNSAQFALQMIEGVPRVRFTLKGASSHAKL